MVAHPTITAETPLDDSMKHRVLTPTVRRIAEHAWTIIRTRALEQGFPVEGAYLDVDEDILEGRHQAVIVVDTAAKSSAVFRFWDTIGDEYQRWAEGLDVKSRKTALHKIRLFFNWTD